ncbi:MAG: hypothetical protein ACK5JU_10510 [Bacteroidales bacterium]
MLKYLFQISAVVLLVSLVGKIIQFEYANYVFAVAAAGIAIAKLNTRYQGSNFRLKRLYRIDSLVGILLIGASYLMFKNMNEWVLCLTIASILQLYTAYIIPRIEEKENGGK